MDLVNVKRSTIRASPYFLFCPALRQRSLSRRYAARYAAWHLAHSGEDDRTGGKEAKASQSECVLRI